MTATAPLPFEMDLNRLRADLRDAVTAALASEVIPHEGIAVTLIRLLAEFVDAASWETENGLSFKETLYFIRQIKRETPEGVTLQ